MSNDHNKKMKIESEEAIGGYANASLISRLTFSWVNDLLKKGFVKPMEASDVPPLTKEFTCKGVKERLEWRWNEEKKKPKPFLGHPIVSGFFFELALSGIAFLPNMAVVLLQPYFVASLLKYTSTGSSSFLGLSTGVGQACVLGVLSLVAVFSSSTSFLYISEGGILIKSAVTALIFEKSIKLSSSSRTVFSTGDIVTLISVDCERLWMGAVYINWLWLGPALAIIAMILLIFEVGIAGVTALGTMILINYIQKVAGERVGATRKRQVKFTADRTTVMNEILQGIRIVKLYAWEVPITKRIEQLRFLEVKELTTYQLLKMVNTSLTFIGPLLVAFTLFITYIYLDTRPKLTVSKVYTTYALLGVIRQPFFQTPNAYACFHEALQSLHRITKFLLLDEINDTHFMIMDGQSNFEQTEVQSGAIEFITESRYPLIAIRNADFFWGAAVEEPSASEKKSALKNHTPIASATPAIAALTNINLTIYNDDFIAIVGSVGSGKTSLVSALTNQLHMIGGEYYQRLAGMNIAYVAQEHWIQNINLRENVLFDAPMDEELYCEVMDASQLTKDLLVLPHADMTFIGERGLNLSGGQKARVNIARALYAKHSSEMYIFDDSLASVDVHVGRALFDEAICGMVKDKCRLVVLSSNYHLLERFGKIVVMEKGSIAMVGTYEEVLKRFPQFSGSDLSSAENKTCLEDKDESYATLHLEERERRDSILADSTHVLGAPLDEEDERPMSLFRHHSSAITERRELALTLMSEEDREKGAVSLSTYVNYFSVASIQQNLMDKTAAAANQKETQPAGLSRRQYFEGLSTVAGIMALFTLSQLSRVFSDLWIGLYAANLHQGTPRHTTDYYLIWYYVLIWGTVLLAVMRSTWFINSCLDASRKLHEVLLTSVLSAPVNTYFDVTPVGRILNRFSKDLDAMDSLLPDFLLQAIQNIFQIVAVVAVCLSSSAYFVVLFIPIALMFYYIQTYFRKSSRELKRLESIARSPMYSLFGEILQGQSTIRAYGRVEGFTTKFFNITDTQVSTFFLFWMANRWLALRLDTVSNLIVFAVAILGVVITDNGGGIDANLLGIGLVYSLQLAFLLQLTVRLTIDAETNATSVERLLAFVDIVSEKSVILADQSESLIDHSVSVGDVELGAINNKQQYAPVETSTSESDSLPLHSVWPSKGDIQFDNLKIRYRPDLSLVLHGVDHTIPGGSKVGVVGRTAAGKSSLMLSLFRIIEPEVGSGIIIDGVNIQAVPLQTLRSSVTIIPQDPFMFSGTLRSNLDPFDIYSDEAVWEALERTHLKQDVIDKFPLKLMHEISERGENISVGQRQMVCIARALLRNSKIIIMDEATASVDSATDRKIQVTIREEFRHCTVLTIAHRLETIADYDLVLVMENGLIAEAGSPLQLLGLSETADGDSNRASPVPEKMGIFQGFVNELGPERKAQFVHAARNRELMNLVAE